eukprot:2296092-Rhodomonas_salina.2
MAQLGHSSDTVTLSLMVGFYAAPECGARWFLCGVLDPRPWTLDPRPSIPRPENLGPDPGP